MSFQNDTERHWSLQGLDCHGGGLEISLGETALKRTYLGLTFGRHPDLCEFVFEDEAMSKRHCRISRSAEGLALEDLNSLNGTYIDSQRLAPFQRTTLPIGSVFSFGGTAFRLWPVA